MKKFTSIALAVLLVAVMMVPMAFAVEEKEVAVSAPAALPWWMMPVKEMSPKRDLPTSWYTPTGSSTASDFVYVKPEGKTVVNTGDGIKDEGEIQNYPLEGITTWVLGDMATKALWKTPASFSKFKSIVKINDNQVPSDMFNASEGSTIIEIANDYMNSLEKGNYTITIEFTDGTATGVFEIVEAAAGAAAGTAAGATGTAGGAAAGGAAAGDAAAGGAAAGGSAAGGAGAGAAATGSTPKTGDNSYTILWAAISLVTLGAIGVVALPLVRKVKA